MWQSRDIFFVLFENCFPVLYLHHFCRNSHTVKIAAVLVFFSAKKNHFCSQEKHIFNPRKTAAKNQVLAKITKTKSSHAKERRSWLDISWRRYTENPYF